MDVPDAWAAAEVAILPSVAIATLPASCRSDGTQCGSAGRTGRVT